MITSDNSLQIVSAHRAIMRNLLIILSIAFLLLTGCSTPITQRAPNPEFYRAEFTQQTKNIFIFFDGSANDWVSRTNVRRLFELIAVQEHPNNLSLYIDGVGSSSTPLTGGIFGYGMKPRILEGYRFLARYYNPGDQIYIFGFSRGAHQARSLAGLIAYNGLPTVNKSKEEGSQLVALQRLVAESEQIWDFSRHKKELTKAQWLAWESGNPAPFAREIKEKHNIETIAATIKFLGIWDTVPGSAIKEYDLYSECGNKIAGVRYKIQAYPAIAEIAHAVSLDEKRSKFRPVLVAKPIDATRTKLHQVWFAGAHADVGGGYEDSNDLAGISLNWMFGLLQGYGIFAGQHPQVYSAVDGLTHWSIGDRPANLGSIYENRVVPEGSILHPSIEARMAAQAVPVRKNKQVVMEKYQGLDWISELYECKALD